MAAGAPAEVEAVVTDLRSAGAVVMVGVGAAAMPQARLVAEAGRRWVGG